MADILTPELDFTVLIKDKTVVFPENYRNLILHGDTNSKRIQFKMHRHQDDVDLAEKDFHIVFENKNGDSNFYDIPTKDVHVEDHIILFDWWIDSAFTSVAGEMQVLIEIDELDDAGNVIYRFQTLPFLMHVEKTLVTNGGAIPNDYYLDIRFYEENQTLKTYPMTSALPSLIIKDRAILMPELKDIIVTKDTRSRLIHFEIGRYFDGIDLSKKTICIKYILPNRTDGDRCLVYNETVTPAAIKFDWLVDSKVTMYPGEVQFIIEFIGYDQENEFYCWNTLPASITISEGLDTDNFIEPPNPSWIQSWSILADKYLSDYSKYIEEVREKSEQVSALYDKTVLLTQEAEKQASISENYSIIAFNEAERAKSYSKEVTEMRKELIEKVNKFYEDYVKLEIKLDSLELSDLSQSLQDLINGKANRDEVRLKLDPIQWCDLSDALKELLNSGEVFSIIDDTSVSTEKTYSSKKIEELIKAIGGSGENTPADMEAILKEIEKILEDYRKKDTPITAEDLDQSLQASLKEKPGDVYIDFSGETVTVPPENDGNSSGEENVIEEIQLNGTALPVSNKTVNIDNVATKDYVNDIIKDFESTSPSHVPTKTSELTNDSHFVTDENYVHTDNNFTNALKSKLEEFTVDSEMSSISDHPVQNKVIKKYIDDHLSANFGEIISVIDSINRTVI